MLRNRFVKSCKSERLPYDVRMPCKMTQFFARGNPFDVRSAEMEFLMHHTKPCATSETLKELQRIRADANRLFKFFQQIFFVESGVCTIALKAIDKRSDFILLIDTNKFLQNSLEELQQPSQTNFYFFWFMVLGPLFYFTATQPLRGFAADSVRFGAHDQTAASRSDASRLE